jgi:5-carboxymethyl-2-hydroxymuconate isomerase
VLTLPQRGEGNFAWNPQGLTALITSAAIATRPDEAAAVSSITEALNTANINPRTGLATDYLNHFNEIVMLLDLLPAMPDLREEVLSWQPVGYCAHFETSQFRERELAVEAYMLAPARYRRAFDTTIDVLNGRVRAAQAAILTLMPEGACREVARLTVEIRTLIARAGAIVNGGIAFTEATSETAQDAIDAIFE